jgi:hypothetical protein
MNLHEKILFLRENNLISLSEIEKQGIHMSSIQYFIRTGSTTQYKQIDNAVNSIIDKKFVLLKELFE